MVYTDRRRIVADTLDELHVFAHALGLPVESFVPLPYPHYAMKATPTIEKACRRAQVVAPHEAVYFGTRTKGNDNRAPATLSPAELKALPVLNSQTGQTELI